MHKNEKVSWFTAVNRCLSNNATLAGFGNDVRLRLYFPSSVLSDNAWIGLVKSWWTWPDLGKFKLCIKIIYVDEMINVSTVIEMIRYYNTSAYGCYSGATQPGK